MTYSLTWTGERYLPWLDNHLAEYEHVHRYLIASHYVADMRVLDIACGEGYGTAILARSARSVIGVDNDAATLAHAERYHKMENTHFVRADAQNFSLTPGSIDVVVSFETIEHFEAHDAFLSAMKTALGAEGVLVISTPNPCIYVADNPFHKRELSRDEFVHLLGKYFAHVQLLGQRLIATSVVAGTTGDHFLRRDGTCRFSVTRVDPDDLDYPVQIDSTLEPGFFIAICSDKHLPIAPNDLMVDVNQTLYNSFVRNRAELQEVHAQYHELERKSMDTSEQLARTETELDNARKSHDTQAIKQAGAEQEYASLRLTIEEQTRHIDALVERMDFVRSREEELRAMFLNAHGELLRRDDELLHRDQEIERLRVNTSRLESQNGEHQLAIARREAQVRELEQYVHTLERTVADKQANEEGLDQYARDLERMVAEKNQHISDLTALIQRLESGRTTLIRDGARAAALRLKALVRLGLTAVVGPRQR